MIVLGLTGSIAMGKSTAADMFRRRGVPVWDADRVVHGLFARGGAAVGPVEAAFPGVVRDGAVDRAALGTRVFGDAAALARLEAIVHPLVYADQRRFLAGAGRAGRRLVVVDVPLLFESGGDRACDTVAVVSAPALVQRQRLRQRPGMDDARIDAVLSRQMPDAEKRRRADFVIPTGLGRACSMRAIARIVAALGCRKCRGKRQGKKAYARGRSRHRNHRH
jgi:dephospho-CoA kinase